jgi:hypothetical protein
MLARHRLRLVLAVALFLASLPLIPWLDRELTARADRGAARLLEQYALPPAGIVRALSFGYNELAADLLWIRSIGYYADHLFGDRDTRHMERYLDTILALDDRFAAIYRYGPSMLISGTGKRTEAEVWAAIRLLKRAARAYPDEWRYPFFLGSYYMTELAGTPEQRRAWRREGAAWVHRAALLGADSPWLPALAATVYSESGQRELAIRHLQELYLTTQDPEMKLQIEGKLKHLEATKMLEDVRQAARAMARAQQEAGLGFVPPDLFGLIWLPPLRPFSLGQ